MDQDTLQETERIDVRRAHRASGLAIDGATRADMPDGAYRLVTRMRTLGVIPRRGVHSWAAEWDVTADDAGHVIGTARAVVAREPAEAAMAAVVALALPKPTYGLASLLGQCPPRLFTDPLAPPERWTFTYDRWRLTVTDTGGRAHISERRRDT